MLVSKNEIRAIISTVLGTAFLRGYMAGTMSDPVLSMFDWITGVKSPNDLNQTVRSDYVQMLLMGMILLDSIANICGELIFPNFAKRFGRKGSILVSLYLVIFAGLLGSYSKYFESVGMLMTGLFLTSLSTGMNNGLAPAYILEISRKEYKGSFSCCYELAHSIGYMVSVIVSKHIADWRHEAWPLSISLTIFPWLGSIFLLPDCPRSPRMLYALRLRRQEAKEALIWLRNTNNVDEELQELHDEYVCNQILFKDFSWQDLFGVKIFRQCLLMSVLLMLSRHVSGMDIIDTLPHIVLTIKRYNLDEHSNMMVFLLMIRIVANIVAIFLVDGRLGRRKLLLISIAGSGISISIEIVYRFLLAGKRHHVIDMLPIASFQAFYSIGLGPISRFLPFELFPLTAALRAVSVAHALGYFMRILFFLNYFWMFSKVPTWAPFNYVMTNLAFVFLLRNIPETRNKTFIDIYRKM